MWLTTLGILLLTGSWLAELPQTGKTKLARPAGSPEARPGWRHVSADGRYTCGPPQPALGLDPFYGKQVDAHGLPVVSSSKVSDYALFEAAYLIDLMLAQRGDLREAMIKGGTRCVVMAHDEFTCDIPEYRWLKPRDYWDRRARGLGGSATDPIVSCAEENLLGYPGDPYAAENILIHEFAHTIHLRGLCVVDDTFDDRLRQTYEKAMAGGLWKGTYAATNREEYWAEGVQSWFDNNRPPDHDHNQVNTRAELIAYDADLARLIEGVFGKTRLVYVKPAERTVPAHLGGWDPAKAPAFAWPPEIEARYQEYLRKKGPAGTTTDAPAGKERGKTRGGESADHRPTVRGR